MTYIIQLDNKSRVIYRQAGDGDRIFWLDALKYSFGAKTVGQTCQGCGRYIPAKELYGVTTDDVMRVSTSHCMRCVDANSRA